jgi:GR25 family glycosyltransferase involved in LPS biosynthesis
MLEELFQIFLTTGSVRDAIIILKKVEEYPHIGLFLSRYFSDIFNTPSLYKITLEFALKCKEYDIAFSMTEKCEKMGTEMKQEISTCIPHIADRYTYYNREIVQKIVDRKINTIPLIIFTITTCKRLDLFEKTMNSFLNCCEDISRIDHWFCVDDNSSDSDREIMRRKYPFFEFHMKSPSEKGHPKSMNIIRRNVLRRNIPYVFHMEDDWKFFVKKPYISMCMEVINSSTGIQQCLINKNYRETEKDCEIIGGIPYITLSGIRYFQHEHTRTQEDIALFNQKYGAVINCAYWPHFSFRPSLFCSNILRQLGEFDENTSHFELDYSTRYRNAGYTSAFLDGISCLHIGRLTTERFDNKVKNAYNLNNEVQFGEKMVAIPGLQTFILNLDTRKDRWENFPKNHLKFLNAERYSAVDGKKILPTEQLQRIFEGNDYNMRRGIVGCALSHIKLCIEFLDSRIEIMCVLEDDIQFATDFQEKFLHLYKNLPENWDLCYLGNHPRNPKVLEDTPPKPVRKGVEESLRESIGGTIGYLISKKGAKKFLEFLDRTGMTNAIDTMQQKSGDVLNLYYSEPSLVYSEYCTFDRMVDTDIQYDHVSLTIPTENRIENERKFYQKLGISVQIGVFDVASYRIGNYSVVIPDEVPDKIKEEKWYDTEKRCFSRLIKGKKYNIQDAIEYNTPLKISLGDNTHISEAINNKQKFLFDTIEDSNLEVNTLLLELVLKMTEDELVKFWTEFFDPAEHETYVQGYNKRFVLRNKKFLVSFPHEEICDLIKEYTFRVNNLKDILNNSTRELLFVYCTRWKKFPKEKYIYVLELIRKYSKNPQNINLLIINGISPNEEIPGVQIRQVFFPQEYHTDIWTVPKIMFDQTEFKRGIENVLKKF